MVLKIVVLSTFRRLQRIRITAVRLLAVNVIVLYLKIQGDGLWTLPQALKFGSAKNTGTGMNITTD